jgi:signal peptidase
MQRPGCLVGLPLPGSPHLPRTRRTRSFEAGRQITPTGEYTFGIEGPAVDARGNLYVVNFGRPGTIGKVAAGASQSELFGVQPEGSVGNAIRFDREGRMFVADYKKHNVFTGRSEWQGRQDLFPFRRFQSAKRLDRRC